MFDFLTQKFSNAFTFLTGKDRLTEKNIEETLNKIRESLLDADVPYEVTDQFIAEVKTEALGKKVLSSISPAEMLMKIVYEKLSVFLGSGKDLKKTDVFSPFILIMGLQGSGKTTTIGKLIHYFKRQAAKEKKQIKILAGSIDFYRPAAIDQLEIVCEKAGAMFFRPDSEDPQEVTKQLMQKKSSELFDVLILDTAGRMHVDEQMLDELQRIKNLLNPSQKILVLDSMTGQESLKVARVFENKVGFDVAILTKTDSDARGGAAFAFSYILSKPIAFIGTGEKTEDLERFHPERMASRILGMGDIQTLSERIDEQIQKAEQEKMEKKFISGNINLDDFAQQLGVMNRMGSLSSLLRYIPGMPAINMSPDIIEQGEKEMKKFKAIISSMTLKERQKPAILDKSRKQRVARGSGVTVKEVEGLLARFEQTRQFVKLFSKGGFGNLFK